MLYILYILVITFLVSIDQLSKYLIVNNFNLYDVKIIIDGFFDITYVQNTGAGFSILEGATYLLISVSIIATLIICYLLIKSTNKEKLGRFSYLLIISGSIGNLIDRIRFSYVVDFLDFVIFKYDFPVFNIADCYITVGAFLLIIATILESIHAKN